MKKNEKLFDAIGQIDERYIAEALEPMYQESVGTSNENKAAMPKKGKLFFYRQRRAVAAAAALVICIGAAGIAQWRLHSEEPGPEMAAYDMAGLSAEDGIALQAEDPAAVAPMRTKVQRRQPTRMRHRDARSRIQRPVSQKFILRLQRQTPGKLPGGLSMKATQKTGRLGNRLYAGTFHRKRLGND